MEGYAPILVLFLVTLFAAGLVLLIGRRLGGLHPDPVKDTPYESGEDPLGRARVRLTVPFFRVAILFLLFEMAAVLLLAWAVAYRGLLHTGRFPLHELLVFLAILLVGYVYALRKGALDWD